MANPEVGQVEPIQAKMNFESEQNVEKAVGLDPESDKITDGVIIGWGPPEETDYDLRRRIKKEQLDERLKAREAREPRKPRPPTRKQRLQGQQRAVDDLMKVRMGPNWGRRG